MRVPERWKAAMFAAVLVTSIAGLLLGADALRPRPPALDRGIELSLVIEGPGWTIAYENDDTPNATVFLFLLEAARTLHFPVTWTNWSPPYSAVFVDAINDARNGQEGRWWQFWVDGAYGTTAADLAVLEGGATIAWRFAAPQR